MKDFVLNKIVRHCYKVKDRIKLYLKKEIASQISWKKKNLEITLLDIPAFKMEEFLKEILNRKYL